MAKKIFTILTFLLFPAVFFTGSGLAANRGELKDLRQAFTAEWKGATDSDQRRELLNNYIKDLTSLEYYMCGNGRDRATINAVRGELRKANNAILGEGEIISDTPEEDATGPEPVAATAVPVVTAPLTAAPAAVKETISPPPTPKTVHTPQTIVSDTRGMAGAPGFEKGNRYHFTLAETGRKSTMTYWATGHRSIDTYGEIWLTVPDGSRHRIAKWKKRYFNKPANDISSYISLKAIKVDISDQVKTPGDYEVEFHWTDGIDPLVIFRVEITS